MLGKSKCRILKEIRQKIAEENDIPYVTRVCTYQGACSGTCPRCEQELRYLEQQLARRQRLGKTVAVTALCAGLALTLAGCGRAATAVPAPGSTEVPTAVPEPTEPGEEPDIEILEGEVAYEPYEPEESVDIEDDLTGMVPPGEGDYGDAGE